jgi:peptidoglycan L-alanyl-D-glutamate endopeptidase CwlK
MPSYSRRSLANLQTCHPSLRKIFKEVIKNYDCTIIQGHRSLEEQDELYRTGKSKLRKGKHNYIPSLAVDVCPYPIDWRDKIRFYHFVGYVKGVADQLGIKIRCGADWDGDNNFKDQTFHDLPHFELLEEEK